MKVLFLVNSVVRQGTYFRWHNLGVGLAGLGHSVVVAAFDHHSSFRQPRLEKRDGISYHILGRSRGQSIFSQESHPLAAWRGVHRGLGAFDVVHSFQPFLTSALPWLLCGRSVARRRLYDWDDLWEGGIVGAATRGAAARWARWLTTRLERGLPRRADRVTVCSPWLEKLARERGARSVSLVENGFWPVRYPERVGARRDFGFRDECLYLGFMGRTITEAELDWLAAAAAKIAQLEVRCRIAVCGFPEELLRTRLAPHDDVVEFLGTLTPERSRAFASALDLGLLPLEDAPLNRARFPIKFSEYLAAGVPVLMSRVGACAELASTWSFVFAADPSREQFVARLAAVVRDMAAGRRPIVDRKLIEDRLTWPRLAESLAAVYENALREEPS